MHKQGILFICMICIAMGSMASEKVEAFKVGEKWVYEHDGPRPGSWRPEAFKGERIQVVDSISGEGESKKWVIKETYGESDERPSRYYLDSKGNYITRDIGSEISLHYNPAVPFTFPDMKIGEKKEINTSIDFGQGSAPIKMTYSRIADESVKAPAGEFKNCHHYQVVMVLTFSREGNEVSISSTQDMWFHPKVNGIVKYVFKREPVTFGGETRDGYTSTSVLKSHTKS